MPQFITVQIMRAVAPFLIALSAIMLMAVPSSMAAPLDRSICSALDQERQNLEKKGINKTIEKGPEWAKAHLDAAGLDQIKRFIYINEQLTFRCPTIVTKLGTDEKKQVEQTKPTAGKPDKITKKRKYLKGPKRPIPARKPKQ